MLPFAFFREATLTSGQGAKTAGPDGALHGSSGARARAPIHAEPAASGAFFRDPRQLVKALVYGLLLVNFVQYILIDIDVARHTMHSGWKWHDWTAAFATTLDETAWFVLLILLELETYVLSDEAFTPVRIWLMQIVRLVCILFIGHAVLAFGKDLVELSRSCDLTVVDPCELAGQGLSFARNLAYVEIEADTCASIEAAPPLVLFDQKQLVTDRRGIRIEWELAWADFIEVVVWLAILALIEIRVRLQDRGITAGSAFRLARVLTPTLYGVLWLIAAYWAFRGHWVYSWDEALWILGFMAIGANLSQWRKEIEAGT